MPLFRLGNWVLEIFWNMGKKMIPTFWTIVFIISYRPSFTPSGRRNASCIPKFHSLIRNIKAVNVSSVSKLSKSVSPLFDVHAEHLI